MKNIDRVGILFSVSSFLVWGTVPLVFKYLASVPDLEVLAHRILWALVILIPWVWWRRNQPHLREIFKSKKKLLGLLLSSVLVTTNWMIFIYAVAIGKTLESSFGYFVSPLIIILLGVWVMGDKLSRVQMLSVGLALSGVFYQLTLMGEVPWISLGLAISWASYGLARKKIQVAAVEGLFVEILFVAPAALVYLGYHQSHNSLAFFNEALGIALVLVLAGVATILPLWLFTEGNKRIPMSVTGFLQYITPTMHFACAVFVFGETLDFHKLVSFGFVWAGLVLVLIWPYLSSRKPHASKASLSLVRPGIYRGRRGPRKSGA